MSECEKKGGKGADKSAGQLKKQTLAQALVNDISFKNAAVQKDCESIFIYLPATR